MVITCLHPVMEKNEAYRGLKIMIINRRSWLLSPFSKIISETDQVPCTENVDVTHYLPQIEYAGNNANVDTFDD